MEAKYSKLCFYDYQTWSEEPLVAKGDDDLHRGKRSREVKCGEPCARATIFGQKLPFLF